MYRLRRLCSNDDDFYEAKNSLKKDVLTLDMMKNQFKASEASLDHCKDPQLAFRKILINLQKNIIRWITLARTSYEKSISYFKKLFHCIDSGMYRITCLCSTAYTRKTTTSFKQRLNEHFQPHRKSTLNEHCKTCEHGRNKS